MNVRLLTVFTTILALGTFAFARGALSDVVKGTKATVHVGEKAAKKTAHGTAKATKKTAHAGEKAASDTGHSTAKAVTKTADVVK